MTNKIISFLIFSALFALSLSATSLASQNISDSCPNTLKAALVTDSALPLEFMNHYELAERAKVRTVVFSELTSEGEIVLLTDGQWYSTEISISGTNTPQGDPRKIIFILGRPLAAKLGYKISKLESGKLEFRGPGAKRLETTIDNLNIQLGKMEVDHITLQPKESGFIEPSEGLEFTTRTKGVYKLYFAFADKDGRLVVHEISYHLGPIVLSKKFVDRAQAVNIELIRALEFLKTKNPSKMMNKILDDIKEERFREIDLGTGNLTAHLSNLRSQMGFASYQKIYRTISEGTGIMSQIAETLTWFAHPNLTPREAAKNLILTGMQDNHQLKPGEIYSMRAVVREYFEGLPEDKTYVKEDPHEWAKELFLTLDERLLQLEKAADSIP